MNTFIITFASSSALLAAPAFAGRDHGWDYARVVRAEPIYSQVRVSNPVEQCHERPVTERTVYRGGADPGATLIGGLIGGVIGHQLGRNHRDGHLATAAGALIGVNAARHHGSRDGRVVERTVYETSCRTVRHTRYEERLDGYDVTYRHHGRLHHTRMPYHPGKRIRVPEHGAPAYEWHDDDYEDD